MTAAFPGSTQVFTTHSDLSDIIYASYLNSVQNEVVAIENTLGHNPQRGAVYSPSATVGDRISVFENDMSSRVGVLERETKNAVAGVLLGTATLIGSSLDWSNPLIFPQIDSTVTVNQISASVLYDNTTGHFFSIAPDPTAWSLNTTLTWTGGNTAGRRGVRIIGSDGRIYAENRKTVGSDTDDIHMSVNWTGMLPVSTTYYLTIQVFNDSGQAVYLKGDSFNSPARADFTRIPG